MLVKEKKPNEYTEGTGRQEQTETDTRHEAQAGSAQAGPPGAQAGTWWGWEHSGPGAAHTGTKQDGTGLGRSHTGREHGTHSDETRSADTATRLGRGVEASWLMNSSCKL